eukprot:124511_1
MNNNIQNNNNISMSTDSFGAQDIPNVADLYYNPDGLSSSNGLLMSRKRYRSGCWNNQCSQKIEYLEKQIQELESDNKEKEEEILRLKKQVEIQKYESEGPQVRRRRFK